MTRRLLGAPALLVVLASPAAAQSFPAGFVDPAPILAAASAEIGEASLRCITFSGTGYGGAVGQTVDNAVNIDWPRIDRLANYTRTINWEAGTSTETFDREPGLNPASWKYGLGWTGGTPTQRATRQTHSVNGATAWHRDGDGPPVAVPPELAEIYQLDLWLNPPGFLKAARLPGADPVAFWRWEQIEKGRDGNVVRPEKVHVVAITMLGKYRVGATVNGRNQIQRVKTTVNIAALGLAADAKTAAAAGIAGTPGFIAPEMIKRTGYDTKVRLTIPPTTTRHGTHRTELNRIADTHHDYTVGHLELRVPGDGDGGGLGPVPRVAAHQAADAHRHLGRARPQGTVLPTALIDCLR